MNGCQTGQPREDITQHSSVGAWEAKTLVQEKKKSKTHQLDLDFIAKRPRQLRMEATTPGLGIHVASFVLNDKSMSYTLTRQKKYITGEASEEAFATLIKIAIAPQDLVDLLFDRTLDDDRWKCQLNDKGALDRCQNKANTQISIAWSERTAERRMIEIDSPQARVSMSLKESPSKVQITDELFELPVPDGFKTTTL